MTILASTFHDTFKLEFASDPLFSLRFKSYFEIYTQQFKGFVNYRALNRI